MRETCAWRFPLLLAALVAGVSGTPVSAGPAQRVLVLTDTTYRAGLPEIPLADTVSLAAPHVCLYAIVVDSVGNFVRATGLAVKLLDTPTVATVVWGPTPGVLVLSQVEGAVGTVRMIVVDTASGTSSDTVVLRAASASIMPRRLPTVRGAAAREGIGACALSGRRLPLLVGCARHAGVQLTLSTAAPRSGTRNVRIVLR
jgi:hypothetical protein